jgi:putative SOS response-associated peptidase YedK
MAVIHSRMPTILPEAVHEAWFEGSAGKEIFLPYPADEMTAYRISTPVNSPRNDDLAIIDPV